MLDSYKIDGKYDLLSLLPDELSALMQELSEPRFRAKQIFSWLARGTDLEGMTNLSKSLREKLAKVAVLLLPTVEETRVSRQDGTRKYLFRLYDGECVEGVLMQYHHGNSLCISSQVGCRMGCAFCASTIGGKIRDLYPSELLGQVIAAEKESGLRVSNIVMMGIGEPLDNYDNVLRFLRLVNHKDGLGIGYRHISLSTSGIVPRIYELAKEDIPLTLSISLHQTTNEKRSEIMPVNRRYPIEELLCACRAYYEATHRRISFEYTLLAGENDSTATARELAALLKNAFRGSDAPLHVNLIRVNTVAERRFVRGSRESIAAFAETLEKMGVTATLRRRLGSDVDAACGQLRRTRGEQKKNEAAEADR